MWSPCNLKEGCLRTSGDQLIIFSKVQNVQVYIMHNEVLMHAHVRDIDFNEM